MKFLKKLWRRIRRWLGFKEDRINEWTRTKLREDGFFRKIMPPMAITNDELDRPVETNLPVKIVDKEPDSPAALSIPFTNLPMNKLIRGEEYLLVFEKDGIRCGTPEEHAKWKAQKAEADAMFGKPNWAKYYGDEAPAFESCKTLKKRGATHFGDFIGKTLYECDRLWEDLCYRIKPGHLRIYRHTDWHTDHQFDFPPIVEISLDADGRIRDISLEL